MMWDSHPLQLGATPLKVWIDGIQQLPTLPDKNTSNGHVTGGQSKHSLERKGIPDVPNWDEERANAVKWEGLPPLEGQKERGKVVFCNVGEVWTRGANGVIEESISASSRLNDTVPEPVTVVVEEGNIVCVGPAAACLPTSATETDRTIDLHGGSISPGLMSFGSPLGLVEISAEPSTGDGLIPDAFTSNIPSILGDSGAVVRAVDALKFQTRNALFVGCSYSALISVIHLCPTQAGLSRRSHSGDIVSRLALEFWRYFWPFHDIPHRIQSCFGTWSPPSGGRGITCCVT